MKRINGRAIIIDGDEVILMFRRRIKDGIVKEYYAIPGGGQLGIVEDEKNIGYIFNCSIISGTPKLGGEELEHNKEDNYYEVRKVKISDLDKYDILEENKALIRKAYEKEN